MSAAAAKDDDLGELIRMVDESLTDLQRLRAELELERLSNLPADERIRVLAPGRYLQLVR